MVSTSRADFENSGGIVGLFVDWDSTQGLDGFSGKVLTREGLVYSYAPACGGGDLISGPLTIDPLPISLSEIKLWGYRTIVSTADEIWVFQPGGSPCNQSFWKNLGSPPGTPVATESTSTSQLKSKF